MPEETADEPDAFVCKCGKAYSYSKFNCECGLQDCGHGWRTGGETRNTCDRCYGGALDAIDGFKSGLLELTQSLVHLGLEPRPDGRSIEDGKRPWYQHVAMVLASLKAENEALRKDLDW